MNRRVQGPIQRETHPVSDKRSFSARPTLVRPVVRVSAPRPIGQRRPRLGRQAGAAVRIDGLGSKGTARRKLSQLCLTSIFRNGRTVIFDLSE